MPLCAHLKQAEETSYSSQEKAHACLKTEQAPPSSNSRTRCCTDITTLELNFVWVISETVEADRLFKAIAHGLYSEGALKYFLIIFASTPPNTVNQELFPKHAAL